MPIQTFTGPADRRSSTEQRLADVESESGGFLPSHMSLALAQSSMDDRQVRRAARLLAREFDLSPSLFFQPAGFDPNTGRVLYRDPVNGGPITLGTARRFLRLHETRIVRQMLEGPLTQGAPARAGEPVRLGTGRVVAVEGARPKIPGVDPARLAAIFRAMAPLPGDGVSLTDALGAAVSVARDRRVNTDLFAANLQVVARFPGLSPSLAVAVAHQAARRRITIRTPADVASLLVPDAAGAIGQLPGYQSSEQTRQTQARIAEAQARGEPVAVTAAQAGVQPIEISQAQQIVAGVTAPTGFLDALRESQTNYIQAAKEIERSGVHIPFSDSWAGHVVGKILDYANRPFDAVFRVASAPVVGLYGAITGNERLVRESLPMEDLRDAWDIVAGRTSTAEEFAKAGIPTWATNIAELAAGVFLADYLDPVQAVLNLSSAARARHLLSGLAEQGKASEWVPRVLQFIDGPVRRIGDLRNLSVAQYLVREASRSRDAERFFGRAVSNFRRYFGAPGLDPVVSSRIFEWVQHGRRLGLDEGDIVEGVRGVLAAGFGIKPEFGSLASRVEAAGRLAEQRGAVQLPLAFEDMSRYAIGPEERLSRDAEQALGLLDDVEADALGQFGSWARMQEIPHMSGPVTRAELALRTSAAADSKIGQVVRSVFQTVPQVIGRDVHINISSAAEAVPDFRRYMIRSQVFSTQEIEAHALELGRRLDPRNPFGPLDATQYLRQIETEMLARIDASKGILDTPEGNALRERIMSAINARVPGRESKFVFGVLTPEDVQRTVDTLERRLEVVRAQMDTASKGGFTKEVEDLKAQESQILDGIEKVKSGVNPAELRDRILPVTQMPNDYRILDPVAYRHGISETIGTWRSWRDAHLAALGRPIPEAKRVVVPFRRFVDQATELVIHRLFMGIWKPLVVLRPAYILRVVGLEETSRFLATAGLSRRLESGRFGSRILTDLDRLLGKERALEVPVTTQDGTVIDRLIFERPGRLPNEPLANNTTNRLAINFAEAPSARLLRSLQEGGGFGTVTPDQEHFFDWWHNVLVREFGMDPLGRRYLQGILEGKGEDEIVADALAFLRDGSGEGPGLARALMGEAHYTPEALELQVRRGVRYLRDLTSGHRELAGAVLDPERYGALSVDTLRAIPEAERPKFVHGPELNEWILTHEGVGKRAVDAISRWILQEPTNRLTRQPYFKSWYDRMLRSMVETARENGIDLTPQVLAGMRENARLFAVDQVRRIMFDFSRSGRLDELTRHFLVFLQPYMEFPVVWSRIIRQNPALIRTFTRLGKLVWDSGFVKTDPDTGEAVVPMSWWFGAAPLLAAFSGGSLKPGPGGGWELSAPLTSFNLFAQSTLNVAPFGEAFGDIPIPMPALNPPAMWAFQRLLEGSDLKTSIKARLVPWLFAYGGLDPGQPASLLPAYLRHAVEGFFPDWLGNETRLQETHFLQLMEAQGLTADALMRQNPGMTRDQAEQRLAAIARKHSEEFARMRAIFGLVFPAAPRINFPTVDLEREFTQLTADPKDGGLGYELGVQTFLERHPENRLITIARTMWDSDVAHTPVAIPTTQGASMLLNTAGARRFAQQHPQWVWAIIPKELREGRFDAGAFFAQIAAGDRVALNPEQFLHSADVQQGWDAYFQEQERWTAWQEANPTLGPGDPPYDAMLNDHNDRIDELKAELPAWGARYNSFEKGGVDPNVMREARALAENRLFGQTDTGKGLREYLSLRDQIENEMRQAGVSNIRTTTAENLGFTKRFDEGVAAIIERHPDFRTAFRLFFKGDLESVRTAGDALLDSLPTSFVKGELNAWWTQYEQLRQGPNAATTDDARNAAYQAIRDYANAAFDQFDNAHNPILLWWATRSPSERQDYLVSLLGRPYAFMSRFDKSVILHDPADAATEGFWQQYSAAQQIIAQREAQDFNNTYDATAAYNALNAWAATQAARNPALAQQFEHANTWGYAFEQSYQDQGPAHPGIFPNTSSTATYWQAFLDALRKVQGVVNAAHLHGVHDPDARNAYVYAQLRQDLEGYAQQLAAESPTFAQQWNWLESQSSDPLISSFMPDSYYPIGVVEK